MTVRWQCTECDTVYDEPDEAARCHWGIGGVMPKFDSNHWYVNGAGYDSFLDACEDAMHAHTVVLDDDDKVVADYTGLDSPVWDGVRPFLKRADR
jgi:hypothetical protein